MTKDQIPDRVWITHVGRYVVVVPPSDMEATQYMRVLTHEQVRKLAESEDGMEICGYTTSLLRIIENQRNQLAILNRKIKERAAPSPSFSPNFDERNGIRD